MKISEQHNIIEDEEEDAEYLVDAILGFKSAGKKGYELLVKWQGYEVGNDTSWEPAKTFLQQWDCESSKIYDFFERENIDVSKCNDFDFISRKPRRKTEQKNKKRNWMGKKEIFNVVISATMRKFLKVTETKTKSTSVI